MDIGPDGDDVRKELAAAIDQLEAIYFLTQSFWHPDPREHILQLRRGAEELPASTLREFLPHVHQDIRGAKDHYGCTLTDREVMETLRLVTDHARPGFVYLPKTQIARWFTKPSKPCEAILQLQRLGSLNTTSSSLPESSGEGKRGRLLAPPSPPVP